MNSLTPVLPTTTDEIREYVGSVTAKGMITIPQEVRRRHKIKPNTKVVIRVSSETIEVKPMPMTLEDIMGSVPPLDPPKSFKEIRESIQDERAEHYFQEINR